MNGIHILQISLKNKASLLLSNLCFLYFVFSDRHKSFKLRLPSIRRDIRRNSSTGISKKPNDEENPPLTAATMLEEAVPLTRLHPSMLPPPPAPTATENASTTTTPLPPQIHTPFMSLTPPTQKRALDRELSDVSRISQWSNDAMMAAGEFRSRRSSQGSLRKASSMENLDTKAKLPLLKSGTISTGTVVRRRKAGRNEEGQRRGEGTGVG